jgi:hypothetical protein
MPKMPRAGHASFQLFNVRAARLSSPTTPAGSGPVGTGAAALPFHPARRQCGAGPSLARRTLRLLTLQRNSGELREWISPIVRIVWIYPKGL